MIEQSIAYGPQIETMQSMWNVLRENGQVSNLQEPLPAKMVSTLNTVIPITISFFVVDNLWIYIQPTRTDISHT